MQQLTKNKDHQFSPYQYQNLTERYPPPTKPVDTQFSPWNSDDYRRFLQPRGYQTINQKHNSHRKKYNRPTVTSNNGNHNRGGFGSKISQDFINLVKLQKRGAFLNSQRIDTRDKIIKMNLVNVNLDYDVIYSPEKKYGLPIHIPNLEKRMSRQDHSRQQPTKVRLSKQIRQRNMMSLDKKRQSEQISGSLKLGQSIEKQHQEQITFYPSMPKRLPKLRDNSHRLTAVYENQRASLLPSLSVEREKEKRLQEQMKDQTILFGKGSILEANSKQKLRKMRYRSYLTKDHFNPHKKQEKILFLYEDGYK